jgi:P4 family phage/plasmid primase-like protien
MEKLNITLTLQKSILDGKKFFEYYNKSALDQLLEDQSDLLHTTPHKHIKNAGYETEKQQLEQYKKQSVDCFNEDKDATVKFAMATVIYRKANGYTFGRVYPVGSLSMCTIRREVRHTIAKVDKEIPLYYDVDAKNCHPEIVYQYMKHNKIECETLERYVKKREWILDEICDDYGVTKEQAKNLMIRLLYFGGFNGWAKDNKLEDAKPNNFLTKFIEERNVYGNVILKANPLIELEVQENKNKSNNFEYNENASVVSVWCQEIENRIIETLYKYSVKHKIIDEKIAVFCYDGLQIFIDNCKVKDTEKIIMSFSSEIEKVFGLDLQYVLKGMDSDYHRYLTDKIEIIKEINAPTSDTQFFKDLLTFSHRQCAELFYSLNKDKYVYSDKSGWYEYNKYNILISTKSNYPLTIKLDVSKCLENYILPFRNRLMPNKISYMSDCKNINKLLKDINNSTYIKSVCSFLDELYNNTEIDTKIDNNGDIIAFSNCLYDYKTLTIRPIKKDDYVCKNTQYEYAKSNSKIKEEIIKTLKSVFEDDKMYEYVISTKARALFGNIDQSCFIYTGNGGNGKGMISEMDQKALGNYWYITENTFITSSFKQGVANPTLTNAKGVRILYVSEPDESNEFGKETSLNTPFLKLITGNDSITTRGLYSDNISYTPLFTPFILCNNTPNIKRVDGGVKRRIKMVNYKLDFRANPDPNIENQRKIDVSLKAKMISETYYREYLLLLFEYASKYKGQEIDIPNDIIDKTNGYFTENNTAKLYLDHFTVPDSKSRIKSSVLKDEYEGRMDTKTNFKQLLRDMAINGIKTVDAKGYKYFCGFRFKTQEEIDADELLIDKELEQQLEPQPEPETEPEPEQKPKKIIKIK